MTRPLTPALSASELQVRLVSARAAAWATLIIGPFGIWYALAFSTHARTALAVLFVLGWLGGAVALALPLERILRSRWREHFFFAWSLLDILMIFAGAVADGGASSPVSMVLFIPMAFAAMSYPVASVVLLGATSVAGYLAIGVWAGADPGRMLMFAISLACMALMSGWYALGRARQRVWLEQASRSDALTGALNRRGFEERLDVELHAAAQRDRPLTLVLVDLDDFKQVNDTLGHAAGDEHLRAVAQELAAAARQTDVVARLGGDEFAVLAADSGMTDSASICERIAAQLGLRFPASLGAAVFPLDGADREELFRAADRRLYEAKPERRTGPIGLPRAEAA